MYKLCILVILDILDTEVDFYGYLLNLLPLSSIIFLIDQ